MKPLLLATLVFFSFGAWGKTTDASKVTLLAEYKRHDIRVTSMCIEGHSVVVTHSELKSSSVPKRGPSKVNSTSMIMNTDRNN